jgi:DcrB
MRRLPHDIPRRRQAIAAVLAGVGLLLGSVGCSDDDESIGEEIGGERVTGTGYSFEGPDGWYDATDAAADLNAGPVDLAIAAELSEEFTTNFNVVRATSAPTKDIDQLGRLMTRQVRPLAEGEITALDRIDLDGSPAVGHELESSTGGTLHYLRQYSTLHDGDVYTMTMSAHQDEVDTAVEVMDEILASWTWEDPTA